MEQMEILKMKKNKKVSEKQNYKLNSRSGIMEENQWTWRQANRKNSVSEMIQ